MIHNLEPGVSIVQVLKDYLESKGVVTIISSTAVAEQLKATTQETIVSPSAEGGNLTSKDNQETKDTKDTTESSSTTQSNEKKAIEDSVLLSAEGGNPILEHNQQAIAQVLKDYLKSNENNSIEDDTPNTDPDSMEMEVDDTPVPLTETPPTAADATTRDISDDADDDADEKERQRRQKEWTDMAKGICQLFDQALPFRLLYPTEQSQLSVLLDTLEEPTTKNSSSSKSTTWPSPSSSLASHYRCAHLLRLSCQLPALLTEQYKNSVNTDGDGGDDGNGETNKYNDDDEIQQVLVKPQLAKFNDLLRFLQKRQGDYFPQRFRKKTVEESKYEQKWTKRYERKRAAAAAAAAAAIVEEDVGDYTQVATN